MQQKSRFAWCWRALERGGGHADHDVAAGEFRQHISEREGSCHGVELVTPFDQSWSSGGIQVGPERDDQDVALEGSRVCLHAFVRGIDGPDCRLHEAQTRLVDGTVRMKDLGGRLSTEHHVQLRESKYESVALIDEDD